MDTAERDARHLQELQNLAGVLKEMGFPSQLLQQSAQVPQPALLTRIPTSQNQKPLEMALTFYPVEPNTVRHALLLQYYIQLPFDFDDVALDQYRLLLPDLNGKAVLGHFGLDIGSHKAHFRYVQTLPIDRPITKAAIIDALILVSYTPAHFNELLSALATKKINADTARKQLQSRYST